MFGFFSRRSRSKKYPPRLRHLRGFEKLEGRAMLTTLADVVFLVDRSLSDSEASTQEWLESIIDELDSHLRTNKGIDVRYGVVDFGNNDSNGHYRSAHSRIVDLNPQPSNRPDLDRLFSDGAHLSDIETVLGVNVPHNNGGFEDGWDAIEHAIAEYDFRPGAVVQFVLVQNDEGRVIDNEALTRSGILAALNSKNVTLNILTAGQAEPFGALELPDQWMPLFDLTRHEITSGDFANRRILGIEADAADDAADHHHDYHLMNTTNGAIVTTKPATRSDALQISFNGSNTGATGMVGSGKSIVISRNINAGALALAA